MAQANLSDALMSGLSTLLVSYEYALDSNATAWDFAVGIDILQAEGVSRADLDWLLAKGIISHRREVTESHSNRRTFLPEGDYRINGDSCFVLTAAGRRLAEAHLRLQETWLPLRTAILRNLDEHAERPNGETVGVDSSQPAPCWNVNARELRVGDTLVKHFRVPARNQELVLSAFEEDGWIVRIDDPLPPNEEIDSRQRLRDTIKSLNRSQQSPLLRFHGDGRAQGVRWTFTMEFRLLG